MNRQKLSEYGFEESIVFENPDFDDAIIGVTEDNLRLPEDDKVPHGLGNGHRRSGGVHRLQHHQSTGISGERTDYTHVQNRGNMTKEERITRDQAMCLLRLSKSRMKPQEFKTIKGQIKAGDIAGAMKGLRKILER